MYIGKTRNPVTVILLSVFTCGIYLFFWYYTVMDDINKVAGEERINPVMLLVLSIVCFPVSLYMLYKIDLEMVNIASREGVSYNSNFLMWVILSILAGIGSLIAMFQITTAFNDIWARRSGGVQ